MTYLLFLLKMLKHVLDENISLVQDSAMEIEGRASPSPPPSPNGEQTLTGTAGHQVLPSQEEAPQPPREEPSRQEAPRSPREEPSRQEAPRPPREEPSQQDPPSCPPPLIRSPSVSSSLRLSRKRRRKSSGSKRAYSAGEMGRIDIDFEEGTCEYSEEIKKARQSDILP